MPFKSKVKRRAYDKQRRSKHQAAKFWRMKRATDSQWARDLRDVPVGYRPDYLDNMLDGSVKQALQQQHDDLVKEAADEDGHCSPLRELLIRRFVWASRMAERLECQFAILDLEITARTPPPKWARRVDVSETEKHLARVAQLHFDLCETLLDMCYYLTKHRPGGTTKPEHVTLKQEIHIPDFEDFLGD